MGKPLGALSLLHSRPNCRCIDGVITMCYGHWGADGSKVVVTNRETLKMVPEDMRAEVTAQLQQWRDTAAALLQLSPPAGSS